MDGDVEAGTASTGAEALGAMLDLSSPRAGYKSVINGSGWLQPMDGLVLTFDRALTEHVLRHTRSSLHG